MRTVHELHFLRLFFFLVLILMPTTHGFSLEFPLQLNPGLLLMHIPQDSRKDLRKECLKVWQFM